MTDPLRFGVFYAPFHHLDENPTLLFERDKELWTLYDKLHVIRTKLELSGRPAPAGLAPAR